MNIALSMNPATSQERRGLKMDLHNSFRKYLDLKLKQKKIAFVIGNVNILYPS